MDVAPSFLIAACLLAFGLVVGAVAYRFPAHYAVPIVVLLAVAYGIAVQRLFDQDGYWLPLAVPMLVQLPLALLMGLLGQFLLERREKQRFSEAVRYYLPENVARELVEKGVKADAANKVVYATCLATDMAGFTTLGESMEAGELATFMNDYFEALAEPLQRNGVDVTEFRADAIMCAWTAESERPDIHFKAASAAGCRAPRLAGLAGSIRSARSASASLVAVMAGGIGCAAVGCVTGGSSRSVSRTKPSRDSGAARPTRNHGQCRCGRSWPAGSASL